MHKDYNKLRPNIRTGDIIEWRTDSFIGRVIRWFTRKSVNHTSLCVCLPLYENYKVPRRFMLEALTGGIALSLISKRLAEHNGEAWYYPLKSAYNDKRDVIGRWAFKQVGTKYDYKSVVGNIAGNVSADAGKFFCSEYVFMALRGAGIVDGKKAPRPGGFAKYGVFDDPIKIK